MPCIELKQQCLSGPVTAVFVLGEKIFCGCCNEISVYDIATGRLEARKQILIGASIHGIRKGTVKEQEQMLLVYGAKQVRVVSVNWSRSTVELTVASEAREFEDWIWDACWLSDKAVSENVALALAHNSVVIWNWRTGEIVSHKRCAENCILYCARFIGNSSDNLLLASGTVFNQVVLWPVTAVTTQVDEETNSPVEILHTFSGHKGVVFAISYQTELQRLCSVSDDRSIRMWQMTFHRGKVENPTINDWKFSKSDLLLSLFGHSARVWDVVMTTDYFVSVGEDATCIIWDYAGRISQKLKGHKGRSIWSLDLSEDEKFVVTGGGDGSVRMWDIQQQTSSQTSQNIIALSVKGSDVQDFPRIVKMLNFDTVLVMMNSGSLYAYNISTQLSTLIFCDANFKSYSIVSPSPDQSLVAVGSMTGDVRILALPETSTEEWNFTEKSYFSGKVLSLTWLDDLFLLVSGPNGQLLLVQLEMTQESGTDVTTLSLEVRCQLRLPSSKHRWATAGCLISASDSQSGALPSSTIVCGDKDGSVHCYLLTFDQEAAETSAFEPSQSFPRVHGKAGVTFVCRRDGQVYSAGRDGCYRVWEMKEGKLTQLHGNKILKGFEWIEQLEWHNSDLLVYGFFSSQFVVWSVTFNQQLMSVQCGGGHRAWGCCHDNGTLRFVYLKAGQVYLVESGHHARQTVVQEALHGRKLCDVRFVQVYQSQKDDLVPVVCTASEDTTVNIGIFDNDHGFTRWMPLTMLKGHLSSVRALALSYPYKQKTSSRNVMWKSADCRDMRNSIGSSGTSGEINTCVLFSGGGRAEIRVWRLNMFELEENHHKNSDRCTMRDSSQFAQSDGPNVQCDNVMNVKNQGSATSVMSLNEEQHSETSTQISQSRLQCQYEHLATHFLGESRHKKQHSTWRSHKLHLDPETRIMNLAVSPILELWNQENCMASGQNSQAKLQHVHILSSAGSDGLLRIFAFDELTRRFSLLAVTSFHQGCVLKVVHYIHYTDADKSKWLPLLLSAATNGNIVLWSMAELIDKHIPQFLGINSTRSSGENTHSSGTECDGVDGGVQDEADDGDYIDFTNVGDKADPQAAQSLVPLCVLKAHQSGVNALHILQVSESQCLLVSGGDDNAVTVQLLDLSASHVTVMSQVTKLDAHAAQVTGIWLVSPHLLVSASVDQRICVWDIKPAVAEGKELQMLACKYVNVADVSSMNVQIYRDSVHLAVAGEGLCLYRIQTGGDAATS